MTTRAFRPPHHIRGNRQGVALIIILAFVVLLSGLIVAFFSRAMSDRQISNTSANRAKAEIFARGAVDQIIADLKQEVVDGSNAPITSGSTTLYMPSSAANAVPQLAGSTGANGLENLVKRSANGIAFSNGSNASKRASNVNSSTNASLNNRTISPSRWNAPLLMPTALNSASDFTPPASVGFTAPDWILVDRTGTNPKGWTPNLIASGTNDTAVVGRYAYNIYDEGGLLDANVVGYPLTSGTAYTSANSDSRAVYKGVLAFADLTQLPGLSSGLSSVNTKRQIVNALVGWRNFASLALDTTYSLSLYTNTSLDQFVFNTTLSGSYADLVLSGTNGFLRPINLNRNTLGPGSQSDQMFASRQQLIRFFTQAVTYHLNNTASTTDNIKLQAALPYLTHFSRALDQPSIVPDTNRPKVVAGTGGNTASGSDDPINPNFLKVPVSGSVTRNDGTAAVAGEPLVKKRFALSRLAWITYKGPSANLSATDPLILALINYGYTLSFLQQGTAANVYKYFGLSWVADTRANGDNQSKWAYNHANSNSTGPFGSLPATGGIITRLGSITGREPDFFELLKASVACGSKAKAGVDSASGNNADSYYYNLDTSLEFAVIQMGANIIDQADLDGFPTSIIFNDGGLLPKEIRGIENLPYIYEVRHGVVQCKAPVFTSGTMIDTGCHAFLDQPELWNPHDSTSPRCAYNTPGNAASGYLTDSSSSPLFPTDFRCVADSMDPDHIDPTGNGAGYWSATVSGRAPDYTGTGGTGKGAVDATVSPSIDPPPTPIVAPFSGLGATPATAFKVNRFILTPNNTALRFTMNEASTASAVDYFREPTLLISSNVAGATLRADGTKNVIVPGNPRASTIPTNAQSADISTIPGCLNSQGILCASDTLRYLGVYLGSAPTSWYYDFTGIGGKKGVIAGTKLKATWYNLMGQHFLNSSFSNSSYYLTYRLQYNVGGVWKTYDEKYINSYNNNSSLFAINFASATGKQTVATGGMVGLYGSTAFDPRTGRFNLPLTPGSNAFPQRPNPPSAAGWLNTASSPSPAYILPTNRPDNTSGYSQALRLNGGGAAGGATLAGGWIAGPNDSNNKPTLATGLFSQNTSAGAQHYTDPDGIIRRAMGAYVSSGVTGLPMATAYSTGLGGSSLQLQSRPIVLNRPFKNVGELGYVFSGTPWKNIDFFTSESGDAPLLDIFCINDSSDSNALTAGKVNLNTRQIPVLQAIIAGAYKDEQNSYSTPPAWKLADLTVGTNSEASKAATALVARTTNAASGQGPLMNVANLVGRFVQGYSNPVSSQPFGGFSDDLTSVFTANTASSNIQRFREAPIRALASVGQTRVWNLMIDVVAQTGRYPSSASSAATPLAAFLVEGEQRYWVHIAIDRYTGQIIDKQVEVVKE